jgi:hypothetical protein
MMTIATGTGGDPVLFNARRYVGTGVARSIAGFGFKPDLVWIKGRSAGGSHALYDSIRGVTKRLETDGSGAQATQVNCLNNFDTDGYSIGTDGSNNGNNVTTVAWGWKAGGAPTAAGKTMTDGTETTISSSATFNGSADMYDTDHFAANGMKRSVNTAGGFSITEYINPGSGIGNRAIPHGLGAIPDMVIFKPHSATGSWLVIHKNMTGNSAMDNNRAVLDTNVTEASYPGVSAATAYHMYTSGTAAWDVNIAGRSVMMYAWKAVTNVSHFGTYVGVSGGNKATTGFRPRFIMTKQITSSSGYASWTMVDVFRATGWGTSGTVAIAAANNPALYADQTKVGGQRAADTNATLCPVTIYDDGFKFTGGDDPESNWYTKTYVYAAFA